MENWTKLLKMFGIAIGSIIAKELITFLKTYILTTKIEKNNNRLNKINKKIGKCKIKLDKIKQGEN